MAVDNVVSLDNVAIELTWSAPSYFQKNGTAYSGDHSGIALTDTSGDTSAFNGQQAVSASVYGAAYAEYTVTAKAATTYATLAGQTYTLRISGEGNARVAEDADNVFNPTNNYMDITIVFDEYGQGSIGTSNAGVNVFASIAPNNTGAEYVVSGTEGQIPTAYSTTGTYAVGDVVLQDSMVYKCNTTINPAEGTFNEVHWDRIDHGADKLAVAMQG